MSTYDIDLNPVLEGASQEELEMIAKQMDERWASSLLGFEEYREAKETGDYTKITSLLAAELREFGGNTIANTTRAITKGDYQGPPYAEIVRDVAKKLEVNTSKDMACDQIEQRILEKTIEKMWGQLSVEEKKELLNSVGGGSVITYSAFSAAMHTVIRNSGFMPYSITLKLLNAMATKIMGRGLSLASNAAVAKFLAASLAKSINVLLWGWFFNDIALSPAFRVTTPCVVLVALSRQRQYAEARVIVCPNCSNECNKTECHFCPKCGNKLDGDK